MQTIAETTPNDSAPQRGAQKGTLAPAPLSAPKNSTESLVDAAMDALSAPPDNDNAVEKRPSKQARREAREGDGEQEEALAREPTPQVGETQDEGEADPEADDGAHADDDTRGTEAEPFSVKDLPSDRFIELKVDGEKLVVPLSELASGYIREQTFSRRINQTKQLTERAMQMAQAAQQFPEKLRQQFKQWTSDPKEVLEFFLDSDEREGVLEQVARRYAEMRIQHREKPELRLAWQRERDLRRLAAERQAFESQRQAEYQAREAQEQHQRAMAIWQPGWAEGLRRAGFPEATPQLQEEVLVRCRQRIQSGHVVTSDDIAEFVARAAKLLELPRGTDKRPQAAPTPAPRPERRTTNGNGGKDWSKVPAHKKRQDVDFFLSGLKPRDYR